jgi:hypothetical protein
MAFRHILAKVDRLNITVSTDEHSLLKGPFAPHPHGAYKTAYESQRSWKNIIHYQILEYSSSVGSGPTSFSSCVEQIA